MLHDAGRTMKWISEAQWQSFAEEGTDVHRAGTSADAWLDRYGDWGVWSRLRHRGPDDTAAMSAALAERFGFKPRGWFARDVARTASEQAPARLVAGEDPGCLTVREWNVLYRVELGGGYSTGLFPDQRLNRRRVLQSGTRRVLNLFAYTCSFSVCAALRGASTLNVDVSRRALARGKENFALNGMDASDGHRFLAEDALKIVPRLARRGESFDLVVLDPPTFGRSDGGIFRIGDDLPGLVEGCARLLAPDGQMLVSCNYARWSEADLREVCTAVLHGTEFSVARGGHPREIPGGAVSLWIRRDANI